MRTGPKLPRASRVVWPNGCPWPSPASPVAREVAKHIRGGLEAEEIVDLWNVVLPEDRNVWYDEEAMAIHFNEEMVGYPD